MRSHEHMGDVVKLLGVIGCVVLLSLVIGAALFSTGGTVSFKHNGQLTVGASD